MSRWRGAIELAGMLLFFPFAYGCALVLLVWALAFGTLLRDGSWEPVARMSAVAVAFIVGGGTAVDRCITAACWTLRDALTVLASLCVTLALAAPVRDLL